jgi:hypothetical protein
METLGTFVTVSDRVLRPETGITYKKLRKTGLSAQFAETSPEVS